MTRCMAAPRKSSVTISRPAALRIKNCRLAERPANKRLGVFEGDLMAGPHLIIRAVIVRHCFTQAAGQAQDGMSNPVGDVFEPHVRPDFVISPVRESVGDFPDARPDPHRMDVKELVEIITDADDVDVFFMLDLKVVHREITRLKAQVKAQRDRLPNPGGSGHGEVHVQALPGAVFFEVMKISGETADGFLCPGNRGGGGAVMGRGATRQQKEETRHCPAPSRRLKNSLSHFYPRPKICDPWNIPQPKNPASARARSSFRDSTVKLVRTVRGLTKTGKKVIEWRMIA